MEVLSQRGLRCIVQFTNARIDELQRMFMTVDRNVLDPVAASHPVRGTKAWKPAREMEL